MSIKKNLLLATVAVVCSQAGAALAVETSPADAGHQTAPGVKTTTTAMQSSTTTVAPSVAQTKKTEKSIPAQAALQLHKMFSGMASFYASKFHGRRTASGATYDQTKLTCAHRTLPFGTKLLVHNPANGKYCVVTVNDRGPFHAKRVMDLSGAAAKLLGIKGVGNIVCYTGKGLDNPHSIQHALLDSSITAVVSSADTRH
ncbi:MAG TPA: septal ring lytic transglycosylase RlpA family protein [Planktothrix sp.]|jgi:rare lipoprotein A